MSSMAQAHGGLDIVSRDKLGNFHEMRVRQGRLEAVNEIELVCHAGRITAYASRASASRDSSEEGMAPRR